MNGFELGNVASSSSSSSSSSPSLPLSEPEDESNDDRSIDESLARDVRAALHLAVGRICRAEDAGNVEEAEGSGGPAFAMSDEAIAALTDLAYHYSTTLFTNDLMAFSRHAKRQTVKTDDVLLVARKDRRGMLSELRRVMRENPDRFTEGAKKPRPRPMARPRGGGATSTASARKRASSRGGGGNGRRSSCVGRKSLSKSKGAAGRWTQSKLSSSSSSSSSSSIDDDSEGGLFVARRKKLKPERKNLNKGSFGKGNNTKEKSDGDGSADGSSSSSDDELEFDAPTGVGGSARKKTLAREMNDSTGERRDVRKNSDSLFRIDSEGSGEDNGAVIDLSSD